MGIPPPTLASNNTSTLFLSATARSSPPLLAMRSLLAVTTYLPALKDL